MVELDHRPKPRSIVIQPRDKDEPALMKGALCRECGNQTVIRKDGCDFCSACGWVGMCG